MDKDLEKIKMIYDYAKFHLGLYTGVVAVSIGIGEIGGAEFIANIFLLKLLAILGVACVVLAGVCGAMVAVNTPEYLDLKFDDFKRRRLTAWIISMRVEQWLFWEHRFFWVGLFFILAVSLFAVFE